MKTAKPQSEAAPVVSDDPPLTAQPIEAPEDLPMLRPTEILTQAGGKTGFETSVPFGLMIAMVAITSAAGAYLVSQLIAPG